MRIAPTATDAQTAMPTKEAESIASSLPRKTASIGTAAASTSITLFDFSSIELGQQHSGEEQGQEKQQSLARMRGLGRRRRDGAVGEGLVNSTGRLTAAPDAGGSAAPRR